LKSDKARPYFLILPSIILISIVGILPMIMVVYYSLHDSFFGGNYIWVGLYWFKQLFVSSDFLDSLMRSFLFSFLALSIQIPLGLLIAKKIPKSGFFASTIIVLIVIPLLIPKIVIGHIWTFLSIPQIGLIDHLANFFNITFDLNTNIFQVWFIILLMDTWHWTSLVVLLCYAGLKAIPFQYYHAAYIDGASNWSIFSKIELPKLKKVLLIAILLRFMDSFIIYTETYVLTRGGPYMSTTFLSHDLVQTATVQFDLGEGGAMAVIYSIIVIITSFIFYKIISIKES
tara:strand:- start:421 stop:1278 length:858 start_codon:yes stop_codon:yes gene_type:complete